MYILVICNNHESDVWMNGSVKFVEELKQKIINIGIWNANLLLQ